MNNGKVRIYELSRELSLENKDILAACERLSIAVKSHSSTITGEDAGRIRSELKNATKTAVAPKPTATAPTKPTPPRPPRSTAASSNAAKGSSPNKPVPKQQILEIRRHRPKPPVKPTEAPDQTAAQDQAVEPSQSSEPEISAPSRPTRSAPERPVNRPRSDRPQAPSPVNPARSQASSDSATIEASPSAPNVELVQPPSRPSKAAKPIKPLLKRDRSRTGDSQSSGPIPIREVDEENLQLKPKPELRRPTKGRPAETDDTSATGDEDAANPGMASPDPETSLRRPTLPRQRKKGRGSSTREEDEQQELRKPKTATKGKRRSYSLLEEEDPLDDVGDGSGEGGDKAPSNLNMSLARPPKPKSAKGASPKPTSTPRSHKPPRRGGDDSQQQRRNRRNQEPQNDRPEMITLTGGLSVHELAEVIKVPETDIIKSLFFKGIATNINQTLDRETAQMVAEEFEILVETAELESEAKKVTEMLDANDLENLVQRPPVITIMGHVDHGKTTLLDAIRKTKVAQGEAGGITQHIGAYHVDLEHKGQSQQIVFLDTPGHEAFTAMRARGARVTDIAILVVAADDGVRPQTIEAISHAKAAGVPIVVAINKIDKETAQPDRVKQELTEHGLVPEEWGGETIMVPVSAISGDNLDNLLEMLLLVSEIEDLHANPDRLAKGTVIEAHLDKARGPVATLLVQNGSLRVGESLVAGSVFGKVRAMIDDRGDRVKTATPSFAVEVLGLSDVPAAGDEFDVYSDEKMARSVADSRADDQRLSRLQQAMASRRVTLSSLSAKAQEGELKELALILKADVQGSIEAILAALQQLPQGEVQVRVLLAAPGEISETDVDLAAASGAVLVGFNTTLASGARQAADQQGVDVRDYDIIYNLLDDIQGAMEGLLEPEMVEDPLGQVEVRAVFAVRKGAVAGCYISSGKVTRNCRIRVQRGGEVVYAGNLDSLKRMKDDVKEVASGFECGIRIDNFNGWKEGDVIEAFKLVTQRRTLTHA